MCDGLPLTGEYNRTRKRKMKTYLVSWQAETSQLYTAEVDASSEEEAIEIARQGDADREEVSDTEVITRFNFRVIDTYTKE